MFIINIALIVGIFGGQFIYIATRNIGKVWLKRIVIVGFFIVLCGIILSLNLIPGLE